MRDMSKGLIEIGVLWLYPRSRRLGFLRPGSLPALLSHCASKKASRPFLDPLLLLGQTPFLKETSSDFVWIFA